MWEKVFCVLGDIIKSLICNVRLQVLELYQQHLHGIPIMDQTNNIHTAPALTSSELWLTPPSTYPCLLLFLTARSLEAPCTSSAVCPERQHFLHPIVNTTNSHLSSRTRSPCVTMTSEGPGVWEARPSVKISPCRSIYQTPRRGASFQEALPVPGCPATSLDGQLTTSRRFSAASPWAWWGQSQ